MEEDRRLLSSQASLPPPDLTAGGENPPLLLSSILAQSASLLPFPPPHSLRLPPPSDVKGERGGFLNDPPTPTLPPLDRAKMAPLLFLLPGTPFPLQSGMPNKFTHRVELVAFQCCFFQVENEGLPPDQHKMKNSFLLGGEALSGPFPPTPIKRFCPLPLICLEKGGRGKRSGCSAARQSSAPKGPTVVPSSQGKTKAGLEAEVKTLTLFQRDAKETKNYFSATPV